MKRRRTTPPSSPPVTLELVKQNLRVDDSLQDDLLNQAIDAATDLIEQRSGHYMMDQQWTAYFDSVPSVALIDIYPIREVVVKYLDSDGVEQTLDPADYDADLVCYPASVEITNEPTVADISNSLRVVADVGYVSAAEVPSALTQAILLCVGTWFQNREGVIVGTITSELPMGVQAAIDAHRVFRL